MRARLARLLAVATGAIVVLLSVLFATADRGGADEVAAAPEPPSLAGPPPGLPSVVERGRAVYGEQRCSTCHSIAGVGNSRYPLDGVGDRLDEVDIRKWIVSPREMNPRVSKRPYDTLPSEDLAALVAYLKQLRKQ